MKTTLALIAALESVLKKVDAHNTASYAVNTGWDFSQGMPNIGPAAGYDDERQVLERAKAEVSQ